MANNKNDKDRTRSGLIERLSLPALQAITDRIYAGGSTKGRSPASPRAISIGSAVHRYNSRIVEEQAIDIELFLRHAYILGSTGSGKTYLIYLLIKSLVEKDQGFCCVDIHGDLTEMLLNFFASVSDPALSRQINSDRLVLIEPFNQEWAPSFNPLHITARQGAYQQATDMLAIFKKLWRDVAWGPRMEEVLRNLLLTLSQADLTLCDAQRLLTDAAFRSAVLGRINDDLVKDYWRERFEPLSDRMKPMYTEPVLNKITAFTNDYYLHHVLAQRGQSIDFRDLLDRRRWILINISKGTLRENAHLIGSLFISKIRTAAMSRADIPEERRVPSFLVVDEFQNFLHYNFEEILSEARKFRLGLIMAHQHLEQLDRSMRESIFGNVASTFMFRLGHTDVREVAAAFKEAEQPLVKQALGSLGTGEVVRRESDGSYRIIKIHRIEKPTALPEKVSRLRAASCQRYCRRRRDIEAQLRAASEPTTALRAAQPAPNNPVAPAQPAGRLIPRRRRGHGAAAADFEEGDL